MTARSKLPRTTSLAPAALVLVAVACTPPPPPAPIVVVVPTAAARAPAPPAEAELLCPAPMIRVPGGALRLASKVAQVADFCMDQHEVTAAEYKECVDRGDCDAEGLECDEAWTYGKPELGAHPVNCVSWAQAHRYCRAAGKRLPAFDEWEWAVRGRSEGSLYPWGTDEPGADHLCWSFGSSRSGTCPVGQFPRSQTPEGLDDMFGNVWEWLSPAKRNGVANVARGSSWNNEDIDRPGKENPGGFTADFDRNDVVGFRCAFGR